MRVGILYTIDGSTSADALLSEFAGGELHGRAVTSTCQFYAAGPSALFLGPSGTYGADQWIEGDAMAVVFAPDYPGVHAGFAEAGLLLAAELVAA